MITLNVLMDLGMGPKRVEQLGHGIAKVASEKPHLNCSQELRTSVIGLGGRFN